MSTKLNDLDYRFQPTVFEFLARLIEADIPVKIIFTGRTQDEQNALYEQGRTTPGQVVTWTRDSKHVMKAPDFKSFAIDVCPWDEFRLNGSDKLKWDAADPVWGKIGAIGEALGMKWGGRWKQKDLSHFEYKRAGPLTNNMI